jgi:hypothetical protein
MKLSNLSMAVRGCASRAAGVAGAADAPAVPTLKDVLGASGITATGYVDAAFINLSSEYDAAMGGTAPLYWDDEGSTKNTFRFKQAGLTLASQPTSGFGALVNVTTGDDANKIHSTPTGSANNVDVTQAFVQYVNGPVTVMGGKFNTLAGAEVIAPTGNTNITRSNAFPNVLPYTHTGVRVAYAPLSTLTLYLGENNGWDANTDGNAQKTMEYGISYSPVAMLSGAVYYYQGENSDAVGASRSLLDVVVTIKPIDPLSIVLNYDDQKMGSTPTAASVSAKAVSGYVNYQFNPQWRTSLRYEKFDDKDGWKFGVADNSIKSSTLTVGYAPVSSFELRGEVRHDGASQAIYTKDGGATDVKSQNVMAVEGLYKF